MLENGKVGGYLVRFSGPKDPDLYGDYFTKSTDYGIFKELPVYFQHGGDSVLKNRRIGVGEIKEDDTGLWFEAQLEKRDEYEAMISQLIDMGRLGYSSGAVGHLVSRKEAPNGTFEITSWPIGEGSIVLNPAEPRNGVMPIKEFLKMVSDEGSEASKAKAGNDHPAPDAVTEPDAQEAGAIAQANLPSDNQTQKSTMKDNEQTEGVVENAISPEIKSLIEAQTARLEEQDKEIKRIAEQFEQSQTTTDKAVKAVVEVPTEGKEVKSGPAYIKELGDSQRQAFARWIKTGDKGAVRNMLGSDELGRDVVELKASNATDMNIGTAADGGNTVTDDMHTEIIRRADERSLAARANVRRFTSKSTTFDIPVDNEADSEFVSTNEAAQYDNDAPAIGQVSVTKVKYSKRTLISNELMEDTHVNLLAYVTDRVAMGKAKTDNDLLVTEVEANGTEFDVFAGTGAIAVDELENIAINDTNMWYVENPADARWIMRPSTHKAIAILDDTSIRRYFDNQAGSGRNILGSDVLYSNKVDAIGSGNKPVLFGNFNYVAQVEDPTLQFLRDPFTRADYGQVRLLWYYRTAFKVMQAGAVGYGRNTTT